MQWCQRLCTALPTDNLTQSIFRNCERVCLDKIESSRLFFIPRLLYIANALLATMTKDLELYNGYLRNRKKGSCIWHHFFKRRGKRGGDISIAWMTCIFLAIARRDAFKDTSCRQCGVNLQVSCVHSRYVKTCSCVTISSH